MHTRINFVGQMSGSILRQIIPVYFYNLRHTILNLGRWHNFLVFVQSYPHPRKKITKIISSLVFKRKIALYRSTLLSRQGISVSGCNLYHAIYGEIVAAIVDRGFRTKRIAEVSDLGYR
jgi:hypothetical protein